VGANLTEHAKTRVYGDVQPQVSRDDGHRTPGANEAADLAFEAGLLVQVQFHPLLIHLEGELKKAPGFPFKD
jgi:hypothetical protein